MPLQYHFTCRLANGIHARPASLLEETSRPFDSRITLTNERTGRAADCKSVLSIVSADIRFADTCILHISGPDEPTALSRLSSFLEKAFPHCDDNLSTANGNGKLHLPPGLSETNLAHMKGVPAVGGIAQGIIFPIGGLEIPSSYVGEAAKNPVAEWKHAEQSLDRLAAYYDSQMSGTTNKTVLEMMRAHRAIARDPELKRQLHQLISEQGQSLAAAIGQVRQFFSSALAESKSEVLRERALDVQDVCNQLFQQAYGHAGKNGAAQLTRESIVVAEQLTPGQFLALDRRYFKGLVLASAGSTSHTVILARSFGIPTLVGVRAAQHTKLEGQQVVLDADAGILVLNPDATTRRYYELEFRRIADREAYLAKAGAHPAITKDGHRLEIAANTASVEETERAFALGAEGIGLFRSEMLFFDRDAAPDEEEQFLIYRKLLNVAKGWPVIIRTLDAGGDKPLPYLKLPAEDNPALGYRAVRIYGEFESLFRTQIRALLRASAFGRVKILIPMIAAVDEARWVKRIISEEQIRCKKDGIAFATNIPVGAMIEVPAAAFAMEALAREFDFFSIGTNDLLQYFAATDRADSRLAHLYSATNPAFLCLLKQIVDNARSLGKWVGLCGEMAGQTRLLPLLTGLGLDEISVGATRIRDLKLELAAWEIAECRQLLSVALNCQTAKEVEELLARTVSSTEAPLIDPELIVLEAEAAGKMEAIKLASDKLYVLGRTDNPREVEQAVWEREQLSSTGFGHEFAIPHCKSDAVRANSLVLVKFKTPVEWDSLDEQPVKVMILLAIRMGHADSKHMAILSKLARRIVDDEFREKIVSTNAREELATILKSSVESPAENHRGAGSAAVLRE